ncbi:retrovirus-related pol polyprotein from transposon TNT 1-94 [Tanacetum coccineum]|uniref:Retrovirus-related pol polyprotein from transposon TNT 1-94 n=1 Tax=Tanacetum coccineum TaxID=301880 RepID=A0ABQ4YDJ4_9ASTR
MFNSSAGLLFFHFSSMDGLGSMHENGPWLIHNNSFILKKWNPDVKLLKEDFVNVPVWVKLHGVHVTAFSDDGLNVIATKLGTLLMLDSYTSDMCMRSWGRSSYARALIERRADVELKDTIVDECLKNIVSNVVKNLKNHSQSPKGVPVGPKVGFKPAKQVYRVVSKNDNANTIGNKKKDEEVRKEVSNLNSFDVLNSVENDVILCINGGTSNLASKDVNYNGASFCNVGSSNTSTTPIVKIDKLERLIINTSGKEKVLMKLWRKKQPAYDEMMMFEDMPKKASSTIRVALMKCIRWNLKKEVILHDHTNSFNQLVCQLANVDDAVKDEEQALLMLSSLPKSYKPFVQTMLTGMTTLTFEDVLKALLDNERMTENDSSSSNDKLLLADDSRRGRNFQRGSSKGRSKSRMGGDRDMSVVECYYFGYKGHMQVRCPQFREDLKSLRDSKGKKKVDGGEMNVVDNESSHICNDRAMFETLNGKGQFGEIKVGSKQMMKIEGVGSVRFKLHDGSVKTALNVKYVPGAARNILSLGVLTSRGYRYVGRKDTCKVYKRDQLVIRGRKIPNNLCYLEGEALQGRTCCGGNKGKKKIEKIVHFSDKDEPRFEKKESYNLEEAITRRTKSLCLVRHILHSGGRIDIVDSLTVGSSSILEWRLASEMSKFLILIFDRKMDFTVWKMTIEDMLIQQGIDEALEEEQPTEMKDDVWKTMQKKASSTIRLTLKGRNFHAVVRKGDRNHEWEDRDMSVVECYYCGDKGHMQVRYPQFREDLKSVRDSKGKKVDSGEMNVARDNLLEIKVGSKQMMNIEGVRSVRFKLQDRSVKTALNVKYVPGAARSILSLGVLTSRGYRYVGRKTLARFTREIN